jgi:hypothetical protein
MNEIHAIVTGVTVTTLARALAEAERRIAAF